MNEKKFVLFGAILEIFSSEIFGKTPRKAISSLKFEDSCHEFLLQQNTYFGNGASRLKFQWWKFIFTFFLIDFSESSTIIFVIRFCFTEKAV